MLIQDVITPRSSYQWEFQKINSSQTNIQDSSEVHILECGLTPYLTLENNEHQLYMIKFASNVVQIQAKQCQSGTHLLPALPHCLQNPKLPLGGPKMAYSAQKGVYPQGFGCSCQLSQNKFFDTITPSTRKEEHRKKKKK